MTQDEIMRMAEQAGMFTHKEVQPEIQAFAKLVAAKERARFAEECIDLVASYGGPVDLKAEIRARGETK